MAMRNKVNVQCSKCGKTIEAEEWIAINGYKNPEQKLKLLKGTLFDVRCKSCGNVCTVGYPMLYNDPKENVMIWLVFDDDEIRHVTDYFKTSKTQITEDREEVDPQCRQRIVRNQFQLREKIMIFDSKLDDKIVEIAKLAYSQTAQRGLNGDNIVVAFFTNENGENRIEMYSEKGKAFVSKLTRDVYNSLEDKYGGKASYAEDRVFIIDDVWALNLLRSLN